jgi:F-type H+-transporting ATPase subunit b
MLLFVAAEEAASNPLIPETVELIVGALAFIAVFAILAKFAFPSMNAMLAERTSRIQGNLEKAEETRRAADEELERYRQQLAGAREESNRIIEEGRRTAEQLRRDIQAKAEQEASATVARAQEEIRVERDRVFQELRQQVASISVELAGRVVGEELDQSAHQRLIDEYIDEVAVSGNGQAQG